MDGVSVLTKSLYRTLTKLSMCMVVYVKWRHFLMLLALILISAALLLYTGYIPELPQTSLSTPTPTTKAPQIISMDKDNEVCVYQARLVEAVVNMVDSSTTFTTKPFKVVTIPCPRRIVDIVFKDGLAVIYIDSEIIDKIKNITWIIWYKQGYEWTLQDREYLPSLVIHNIYEIMLKKLEDYSTLVVVKIELVNGSVEVEEIGVGGYIPYTV